MKSKLCDIIAMEDCLLRTKGTAACKFLKYFGQASVRGSEMTSHAYQDVVSSGRVLLYKLAGWHIRKQHLI
jgi:hypothetical protein